MDQRILVFKRCLSSGAERHHVVYPELIRYRDVNTFLNDHGDDIGSPIDLAADALTDLCQGDQKSMDRAICSAVIQFLDLNLGTRIGDADNRRLVELVGLEKDIRHLPMIQRAQQFRQWINGWYQ